MFNIKNIKAHLYAGFNLAYLLQVSRAWWFEPTFKLESNGALFELETDLASLSSSSSLSQFLQIKGLSGYPEWVKDCSEACYRNQGTCNLLTGECACPVGRTTRSPGMPCRIRLALAYAYERRFVHVSRMYMAYIGCDVCLGIKRLKTYAGIRFDDVHCYMNFTSNEFNQLQYHKMMMKFMEQML